MVVFRNLVRVAIAQASKKLAVKVGYSVECDLRIFLASLWQIKVPWRDDDNNLVSFYAQGHVA